MSENSWKAGKTEWEAIEYLHNCFVSLNTQIAALRYDLNQKIASERTTGPLVTIHTHNTTSETP